MKVILTHEVTGLGQAGEVVDVQDGYARNFLFRRALATPWTKSGQDRGEAIADDLAVREKELVEARQDIKGRFKVRAGVGGRQGSGVSIKPLEDRVIVMSFEGGGKTVSGLVIPDTGAEKPQEGEVLAVGPGRIDDKGNRVPLEVRVGDRVIYSRYGGTEINHGGEEYLILSARDLLSVLDPDDGTSAPQVPPRATGGAAESGLEGSFALLTGGDAEAAESELSSDLDAERDRLLSALWAPELHEAWMNGANAMLSGRKPVDVWSRGDRETVLEALATAVDGWQ